MLFTYIFRSLCQLWAQPALPFRLVAFVRLCMHCGTHFLLAGALITKAVPICTAFLGDAADLYHGKMTIMVSRQYTT